MAESRKKRPQHAPHTNIADPEISFVSILMALIGLLWMLCLVSYDYRDLPTWVDIHIEDPPQSPARNFFGPAGAVVGGYSFFLFGIAAFLMPVVLIVIGMMMILFKMRVGLRTSLGFFLVLLAASSAFQIQPFGLQQAWKSHNMWGPGGGIGDLFGRRFLLPVLGQWGSLFMLGAGYLSGLLLLFGLTPRELIREGTMLTRRLRRKAKEFRALLAQRQEASQAAASAGPIVFREMIPEKEKEPVIEGPGAFSELVNKRKKNPPASKTEPENPAQVETATSPPPFPAAPPEITDSFAPTPSLPNGEAKKPFITDVLEKRQAEKRAKAESAPMGSLSSIFRDYALPPLDLLEKRAALAAPTDQHELHSIQQNIIRTLASFGIQVTPGPITRGPTITRYEIYPGDGLRVSRIAALESDLWRATKAEHINILAPIPGKDTVGIEIANKIKVAVPLGELLESDAFEHSKAKLPVAIGKDVYGKTIIADLAAMPHLLIAGTTGSGKSVCTNAIIASLLYQFAPDELRIVMIDPKVVEMQNYADLPHLALPVITEPKKTLLALRWVVKEMERRYKMFGKVGVRNFDTFNKRHEKAEAAKPAVIPIDLDELDAGFNSDSMPNLDPFGTFDAEPASASPKVRDIDMGEIPETIPYLVVLIDELADLMQTAPADIEGAIVRIAQMARAAGIHLIVATQTPRADVVTGIIKANIPSRIAFQVASGLDSRVILDSKGAEKLVGKGDLLYLPPGTSKLLRAQGAFVTDEEIGRLVDFCKAQGKPVFAATISDDDEEGEEDEDEITAEDEETLKKCLAVVQQEQRASTSLLQRRLRLGYNRAARMMDLMEERGVIGPGEGAKPREILVSMGSEI